MRSVVLKRVLRRRSSCSWIRNLDECKMLSGLTSMFKRNVESDSSAAGPAPLGQSVKKLGASGNHSDSKQETAVTDKPTHEQTQTYHRQTGANMISNRQGLENDSKQISSNETTENTTVAEAKGKGWDIAEKTITHEINEGGRKDTKEQVNHHGNMETELVSYSKRNCNIELKLNTQDQSSCKCDRGLHTPKTTECVRTDYSSVKWRSNPNTTETSTAVPLEFSDNISTKQNGKEKGNDKGLRKCGDDKQEEVTDARLANASDLPLTAPEKGRGAAGAETNISINRNKEEHTSKYFGNGLVSNKDTASSVKSNEENGARPKDLQRPSKPTSHEVEGLNSGGLQPLISPSTENIETDSLQRLSQVHKERNDSSQSNVNEIHPVNDTTSITLSRGQAYKVEVVKIPTREQLANELGFGLPRGGDGEDVLKVGGMFIQKCKVLGQGPNSVVFEGRLEAPNGIPIAVKRITCKDKHMAVRTQKEMDELWKKLNREVEILRGVEQWRHPNIVGYYSSQTSLNELYIAFQLCQGDLEDYVSEEYKFWRQHISPRTINQHMAEGVRFLHANSIVHRDLKPKNVFLVWKQGNCHAVIGDLGMSKVTVRGAYSLSLSVGSIGYCAPEVWEEASKVVRFDNKERPKIENKSDIFPLGLLFFFTTTYGQNPFGDDLLRNQLGIAAGRPPAFHHNRPEDYALEVLLRKMFGRNPSTRPTAEEVCAHPGLWENDAILKFFTDCSDLIESMCKEGRSVDLIVSNSILPHGNWMRDLPDALRNYLKKYRANGKLMYQGKEASARYLLRAIRNIAAHFPDLPDNVRDDFTVHQAEFWMCKCPLLLTSLFMNIELSKVTVPNVKKYIVAVPSNKSCSEENSTIVNMEKKENSSSSMKKDHTKSGDPVSKRKLVRKRRTKSATGINTSNIELLNLPSDWTTMPVDDPIKIVELSDNSKEYQQVAGQFITEATSGPYSHKMEFDLTKLRVTKVRKIQNRRLYQQFSVRRSQIADENGPEFGDRPLCRRLWHGTSSDSVPGIIHNGFNRGYSGKNGTWYGEGVYFAVSASYAARSWITQCIPGKKEEGHIFLADVVVGCSCRGHYGMRYLPPIDPDEPMVLYDSAADNQDNPMEYVIFHDTQAYPTYLVTFTSA